MEENVGLKGEWSVKFHVHFEAELGKFLDGRDTVLKCSVVWWYYILYRGIFIKP